MSAFVVLAILARDLVPVALAHVPHATITAIAVPQDLSPSVPWFVTHDYGAASTLYASLDAGDTWSAVGGDPTGDALLAGGYTADGTVVMLAQTGYRWSDDGGATWESAALDLPASRLATGDGIVIGGGTELLVGDVGSALLTVSLDGTALVDVSAGPGGFVAVTDRVWTGSGSTWSALPALDGTPTRAIAASDAVYAGQKDGSVWRWDGSAWTACGATPYVTADHPDVVALAVDPQTPGSVYVGSASRGPAVSTDDCATWTDVGAPMDSVFTGAGSVTNDDETTTNLTISGGSIFQAGWNGASTSTDGGHSWNWRPVLAPDLLRGVAFSPDFDHDGVILLGGDSGGVELTADAGATWSSPALGLVNANIQDVRFSPDDPSVVYADANHTPVRSDDGGTTWTSLSVPFAPVRGWTVDGRGKLWLTGDAASGTTFAGTAAVSSDKGVTWHPIATLDQTVVWDNFTSTQNELCAQSSAVLTCSADDGKTWTPLDFGGSRVSALVEGDGILVASTGTSGLWTVDDNAAPVLTRDGVADPVLTLALADDDTLFGVTRSGAIITSVDRGLTWSDTLARMTANAPTMATRPGFAQHPDLLLASYDGGWLYNADGLQRFGRYERLDDSGGFLTVDGTVTEPDAVSAIGNCTPMRPASTASGAVRGTRIRVLGHAGGSSQIAFSVDGVQVATLGDSVVSGQGELWSSGELTDGWHRVGLEGLVGDDVCLDGVEATGPATALDWTAAPMVPVKRCNCASTSGGSSAALVALAGLLVRRRRR